MVIFMRNKKSVVIFIIAAVLILVSGIIVLNEVGFFEKYKPSEIAGKVIEVDDTSILLKNNGGVYSIPVTPSIPVFDSDGNGRDIRKIQVGQRIVVKYKGGINEIYSSIIIIHGT